MIRQIKLNKLIIKKMKKNKLLVLETFKNLKINQKK